jgi:hypothetical protein
MIGKVGTLYGELGADHQAGAHQQHHGEPNLAHYRGAAREALARAAGNPAAGLLERREEIAAC